MATTFVPTDAAELLSRDFVSRREAVDSVLGTMAAEGDVPSSESLYDMERYVSGEISLPELTNALLRRALQ